MFECNQASVEPEAEPPDAPGIVYDAPVINRDDTERVIAHGGEELVVLSRLRKWSRYLGRRVPFDKSRRRSPMRTDRLGHAVDDSVGALPRRPQSLPSRLA